MNRLSLLTAALLASATMLASADDTPPAAPATAATTTEAPAKPAPREACVQTGSRIARRDGHCNANAGRSYDEEQIRQTGANDLGQALQLLDPGITVNRR